jgi:hypothetical protein
MEFQSINNNAHFSSKEWDEYPEWALLKSFILKTHDRYFINITWRYSPT